MLSVLYNASMKNKQVVAIVCQNTHMGIRFAKFLAKCSGSKVFSYNAHEVVTVLVRYAVATSDSTDLLRGDNFMAIVVDSSLPKAIKKEIQRNLMPGCLLGFAAYYEADLTVAPGAI